MKLPQHSGAASPGGSFFVLTAWQIGENAISGLPAPLAASVGLRSLSVDEAVLTVAAPSASAAARDGCEVVRVASFQTWPSGLAFQRARSRRGVERAESVADARRQFGPRGTHRGLLRRPIVVANFPGFDFEVILAGDCELPFVLQLVFESVLLFALLGVFNGSENLLATTER